MVSRKRTRQEVDPPADVAEEVSSVSSLLSLIRSMWEFACLMQFIYIFGKAVKIDEDLDIEVSTHFPQRPYTSVINPLTATS
jgi:hypothetical protein